MYNQSLSRIPSLHKLQKLCQLLTHILHGSDFTIHSPIHTTYSWKYFWNRQLHTALYITSVMSATLATQSHSHTVTFSRCVGSRETSEQILMQHKWNKKRKAVGQLLHISNSTNITLSEIKIYTQLSSWRPATAQWLLWQKFTHTIPNENSSTSHCCRHFKNDIRPELLQCLARSSSLEVGKLQSSNCTMILFVFCVETESARLLVTAH